MKYIPTLNPKLSPLVNQTPLHNLKRIDMQDENIYMCVFITNWLFKNVVAVNTE